MTKERIPYKEIILNWKTQQPGRQVPIPNKGEPDIRINAYLDLFQTLLDSGYDKDEITSGAVRSVVIHHSHNPNHRDSKKRKIWEDLAEENFDQALSLHPDLCTKIEISKFDHSRANFQTPEAKPYQPNLADLSEEKISTVIPETIRSLEDAPEEKPVKKKEMTPEEWAKVPEVNVEYDEELRLLLGFKNE